MLIEARFSGNRRGKDFLLPVFMVFRNDGERSGVHCLEDAYLEHTDYPVS
jgi:hypothetical protein